MERVGGRRVCGGRDFREEGYVVCGGRDVGGRVCV